MDINQVLNKINDLLAYHKAELVDNIKKLGYKLNDNTDQAVIIFIMKNITADINIENMITSMLDKYDKKSNAEGTGKKLDINKMPKIALWAGVILAIGGIGVAYYFLIYKK